jgi:hypothetical protein
MYDRHHYVLLRLNHRLGEHSTPLDQRRWHAEPLDPIEDHHEQLPRHRARAPRATCACGAPELRGLATNQPTPPAPFRSPHPDGGPPAAARRGRKPVR